MQRQFPEQGRHMQSVVQEERNLLSNSLAFRGKHKCERRVARLCAKVFETFR